MINNIFILNKNKVVVDILSNNGTSPKSPFFDDLYVQYLETGAETFEFSTIANERTNVYCQTGSFVAFNYQDKVKMFQITETNETHEGNSIIKTCYCEMAGIELTNYAIRAMEIQSVNVVQFLETVLSDTSWGIGSVDSSIADVLSIVIEKPTNVYTLLQEYLPKFNCELEFYTDIKNNRVAGQYINIYSKRGSETLKRFEYSENVSNVTRQMDVSQVATAMIGIGKNGLTFKNAEWTSSDPAVKPKNQDFIVNPDAYEKWNKYGEHILGIYENTEVESEYELLKLTWEELKKVSDPKFNYEVETVMIQSDEDEVSIGDTVYVIDHEYDSSGLYLEARIGQLEISFTDHTQNKCQLTNYKEVQSGIRKQLSESQINNLINSYFPIGSNKIQDGAITEGKIDKTYYSLIKTDIVQASVADVQVLVADKANIEDLNASNAKIENLIAGNITISGKITAAEANIEELKANNITVSGKLEANEAEIGKLKANEVTVNGKLEANEAEIGKLQANNATVNGKLEANVADINILKSNVAEIDTLLAGNLTAKNIQAGSITAGSGVIANGAIGSAQISELEATKISSGTIDTSRVTVAGPNSNLKMSGNRLQVFQGIGSKQVERVSLGDIQGDGTQYGFLVRGADGKTVIMDENGVTNAGITDGSITNEKVSGNANIDGAKLNINSVINRINVDGSETIQGTKIDVDGTNLSAKLSSITTNQTDQGRVIAENSSKIAANESAINLKVDSQTYQADQTEINTKLNKNITDISLMQNEIALKAEKSEVETAIGDLSKIDLKYWARQYFNSPIYVKDPSNKIYDDSGVGINPPIGSMFGAMFDNGYIQGGIDTPSTAWALINLCKLYRMKADKVILEYINNTAKFFVDYAIDCNFYGAEFKALPNSFNYDWEKNCWSANFNFIQMRTFFHVAFALSEAYSITKNNNYKDLSGKLLDAAHTYQNNLKDRIRGNEIQSWMNGAFYNAINFDSGSYSPSWTDFTTTILDVVYYSISSYVKNIGNEQRTNAEGISYRVQNILDDYKSWYLEAYNNHGMRRSAGHNLLYCFYHFDWSDSTDSNGAYIPKAMNWDWNNDIWSSESWFTGDLEFWAIQGLALIGETEKTKSLLDAYYKIRVKNTDELLFYDRYTANGTPLDDDKTISIVFTSLFLGANRAIENKEYDTDCISTVRKYQIKSTNVSTDGAFKWDITQNDSVLESKTLGEIIYSPIQDTHFKFNADSLMGEVSNNLGEFDIRLSSAEQKITPESIAATVKSIKTDGKNTFIQQSDITQLNNSWTAKFNDGYDQGITTINKDGITVTASNVKSKTSMTANGFKITKTSNNEDVFSVNSSGDLTVKGTIQGSSIIGSTFTSTNEVFKVLNDGTVETDTLNVNDEISTDKLIVDEIVNTKYQAVLDASGTTVTIKPSATSSADTFYNGAVYKSIEDFKDVAPRNLNGYTLTINLAENLSEDVEFNNFNSGQVNLNFNGFTLKGSLYCYGTSMVYRVYGNKNGSTGGTTRGKVMPNIGRSMTSNRYGLVFEYCRFMLYDMDVYKGKGTDMNECGVGVTNTAIGYISSLKFVNLPIYGLRCHATSHVYVASSNGMTRDQAFHAVSGSIIHLNNTTQAGRSGSTSHLTKSGNGQIFADGVTYTTTAATGTNDSTTTVTAKTKTISANYGDTYRKTVYNNWKKDGTVRQGNYGYGECVGCWFFGDNISDMSGKNITKVTITIKRQAGGTSGAVTHGLKLHNHGTRPSAAPTFRSDFSKNFSVATNNSITVTLSSSEELSAFKKAKGFGLVPASQSSTYYSVCSGAATVKIYYKE